MIIDSHSHCLPEEIISHSHFFSRAWGDIESQIKMMEENGIDKAVVTYPTTDAHLKLGSFSLAARIYNDNIARLIKHYPERFIAAAILPIDNTNEMLDTMEIATKKLGFQAISLASSYNGIYLDDQRFLSVYKKAQEQNIPVFVHSQIVNPIGFERVDDPLLTPVIEYIFDITISIGKLLMSDILRDYPGVKFIFANFGGAIPFLAHRFDATYQMLRQINFVKDLKASPTEYLRNIYVDTGGDKIKANFLLALDLFGTEHILWGSDWPAKRDVSSSINAVNDLNISEDDKAKILGRNLETLFYTPGV